jgi:branched-chain amino acid transport system substrate-binding protein
MITARGPVRTEEVRVGMTASLSGRYGSLGAQALAGATCWAEDVNRRGGLLVRERGGRIPIRFIQYDDASDRSTAAAGTRRLLQKDRVDLLLGPYASDLTLTAARVAEAFGVVLWNHGGAADTLYARGFSWIVGILCPASRYFTGILELVHHLDPAARRLVLLGAGGSSFADAVVAGADAHARALGFEVVHQGDHHVLAGRQEGRLAPLRASRPDLVLAAGAFDDDVRFAGQLVEQAIPAKAVGLVAAGVDAFHGRLGDVADGFLGPSQWEPAVAGRPDVGPASHAVAERLGGAAGTVDYPAAQAYAAGLVIERCVETAGTLDPRRLRGVAGQLDFTTFYGRFRIDPATGRQVGHEPVVVQWQPDGKRVVWPLQTAAAPAAYPLRVHPG